MKLTKQNVLGPNPSIFGQEQGFPNIYTYTEYPKMTNFRYPKPVQKYCILIEFIFLQKTCSN